MGKTYLSKSAFMVARPCPTKLYYYLHRYPSDNDQDAYLEMLADGGFVVGKIAQILFPEGVLVDTSQGVEEAFQRTIELLKQDRVTLFEATFISGQKSVSVDILVKEGDSIKLIEVKSKSFNKDEDLAARDEGKRGLMWNAKGTAIQSDWREVVDDIAYQTMVVREVLPSAQISSFLLLPDTSKRVPMDKLASQFRLERQQEGPRTLVAAHFLGDEEELRKNHFLVSVDCSDAVALVTPEVVALCEQLLPSMLGSVEKIGPLLSKKCNSCEFHATAKDERDGFRECWGDRADVSPHLFDLYFGGALKKDGRFLWDELIEAGADSLFDIPLDALGGKRGERQRIQIEYTRKDNEWFSPELKDFLLSARYPLHFVDFETSRLAVPMHHHMRPFEQVAFQWSCHTLRDPQSEPVHHDWINTEAEFPNFQFARKLMECVGRDGTVFVWATHEQTTLRDILSQMKRFGIKDDELTEWLELMVGDVAAQGRLVDMNQLALKYYFHPLMGGSTSLKYVLPAIWSCSKDIGKAPWLSRFIKVVDGKLLSPYEALTPIEIGGVSQSVREGTAAMTAYQEMVFGAGAQDKVLHEKWKVLLRQYCELDTLAMVVVFRHWLYGEPGV